MNPLFILKTTLNTLAKNKLRSGITLLGIIFGIAIIVTMYNIGLGIKDKITDMFNELGSNIIMIRSWSWSKEYFERFKVVTVKDANFIKEKCPEIYLTMPYSEGYLPIRHKNNNKQTKLAYVSAEYFYVSDKKLDEGNFFGLSDQKLASNVCVLGQGIAKKLFESQEPVGGKVVINNIPFKVIGVFDHLPRDYSPFTPDFPDNTVYLPYTTAISKLGASQRGEVDTLIIFAYPDANLNDLADKIKKILNDKYHITGDKESFNVETISQYLEFRNKWIKDQTNLLIAIAMVALFISGINIMNIMLVSVKERTREIGVRLALGATKKDIIAQFLIEAVVLCVFGGIFGAVLSFPLSVFGADLFKSPVKFSFNIIFVTFFYSVILGVAFGVYPASRAASVEPIDALRYE